MTAIGYLTLARVVDRLLPSPIRRRLLRNTLNRLRSECMAGRSPSQQTLELARLAWGNRDFAADVDYLQVVAASISNTTGPILECGSGLTTLVAAVLLEGRNRECIALEHDPLWRDRVTSTLEALDLTDVSVRAAPLRSYGDFDWYSLPDEMPATLEVVICDGPPKSTKGGRYGAWPLLVDRFTPATCVLLDDASRSGEKAVLEKWGEDFGISIDSHPSRQFAIVRPR